MTHTVTRRGTLSTTGSIIVLLLIVSACAAPARAPVPRTPAAVAEVRRPTGTPSPTPPALELAIPADTAGPTATAAITTPPATAAPPTPTATPLPYLGKEALGGWRQHLSALLTGEPAPPPGRPSAAENAAALGSTGAVSLAAGGTLAQLQAGVPDSQPTIALVGDSWVDGDVILGEQLRNALQARYGNGGAGFVEFGGGGEAKGAPRGQDVTYERAGSWTVHDAFTQPLGSGVDLADAGSTDVTTPAAITLSGAFGEAVVHYIKMPGGGSFRWRVDSGTWHRVSTASPNVALATERVDGLSAARHTLKIELTSAGTAGVRLAGADLRMPGSGVRLDRVGMNGATSGSYAMADAGLWQAGLSALGPDLVILLLGTNDEAHQRLPSQYREDMDTILGRIRSAVPRAGILLLGPGDNNLKATGKSPLGMDEYNAQLRALALQRDVAFLDSSLVIGPFTDANARGLYHDGIHINQAGGKVLADYLLQNLLDAP